MKHPVMRRVLPGIFLLLLGLGLLGLWGCGGSGGPSGEGAASTSVTVVFPSQQASLGQEHNLDITPHQAYSPQVTFANLLENLRGVYEIRVAYAQVFPASVERLELYVSSPDFSPKGPFPVDRATGRAIVPVQVGNDRVFEVKAFPPGSNSPPNFIGRTPPTTVSANGTSVTVNMELADPHQLSVDIIRK